MFGAAYFLEQSHNCSSVLKVLRNLAYWDDDDDRDQGLPRSAQKAEHILHTKQQFLRRGNLLVEVQLLFGKEIFALESGSSEAKATHLVRFTFFARPSFQEQAVSFYVEIWL